MTQTDLAAVVGAFTALTDALHEAGRKRRALTCVAGLAVVLLVALISIQLGISTSNRQTLSIVRDATDPSGQLRQESDARLVDALRRINCTTLYADGIYLDSCSDVVNELDAQRGSP